MFQQYYLYLSSNDSLHYYPQNSAASYTNRLTSPLNLDINNWVVGLVDIICDSALPLNSYVITCDVARTSFYNDKQINILGLPHKSDSTQINPAIKRPIYFPICRENINSIKIQLLNRNLKPIEDFEGHVTCLLHIRKIKPCH